MSEKTELTGMVLSAAPIGEYDKRLVLLTKERGKIHVFAKGAKRLNSPLMAAARPFVFGTFECYEGHSSWTVYQAQIRNYFEKLSTDFEAACFGMYFLEIADYYSRENNDEVQLLKLLYVTLKALEKGTIPKELVRRIFEFKAMVISGEYPDCFSCICCGKKEHLAGYLTVRNGLLCPECMQLLKGRPLSEAAVYALQFIASAAPEKLYTFTLREEVLRETDIFVEAFRAKYMDREFKSLAVLESMTERL